MAACGPIPIRDKCLRVLSQNTILQNLSAFLHTGDMKPAVRVRQGW